MELYDVMSTTFASRNFTDEPLPDETLFKILDHARFAPSGGNRQGWKVIVVRDKKTREGLSRAGEPAAKRYAARSKWARPRGTPSSAAEWTPSPSSAPRLRPRLLSRASRPR
jgi:Nitroreductase